MRLLSVAAHPPALLAADRRRLGDFQLRLLAPQDVPLVLALREEVLAGLADPDLYVREDDEEAFVRAHIGADPTSSGETIGVFDGSRLAAYAMLGLPSPDHPDNLGRVLARGRDAANIASCMVRPGYRGRGLQRTLLAARFSLAQAHGKVVCVAMVSLHNHASRHNLLREGMRIAWVGQLGGLRRQLLAIDLARPWDFDEENLRLVDPLDWERQRSLTAQGWWGISEMEGRGPDKLVFARHQPATPAVPT
ncbi:MAG TPA: GNAT family N-acetyltransferase [Ramlibacter sp.]|jgi:ribosomal protein S18 acetylase RimI-like enzyme|uniref:GNAT family N-acetyltransferase n=1 Tax=Ramlibacter sp. TaxID=1917967 RepID=UPI002D6494AF|nr:GNAT family N-acetyltransferase [Ramlibacter sp.]HZY20487.1 GNAT family N-acetyltransferase [Ramlibacter sp.]